ncbi:MAG: DUF5131 family protein [Chthoniobacterales bacterium]
MSGTEPRLSSQPVVPLPSAVQTARPNQLLPKRDDRMRELAAKLTWPKNVWMGACVEDRRVFHRIDDLREAPAAIRLLSREPLIGSVAEWICGEFAESDRGQLQNLARWCFLPESLRGIRSDIQPAAAYHEQSRIRRGRGR